MNFIRRNLDFLALAIVLAFFVCIASERLATAPVPDSDESMMLQISYEMMNHGKLAFPMKRFYGGNIENAWHSFTPVVFTALSGFMKLFGWGLAQGRAFNLITSVFVLIMAYLIGRKLFGWQVGLIAVVLMISDPVFLTRSRLVRHDMLAAAFGLLAFYLFERAEEKTVAEEKRGKWYLVISGLAAGAAVMCHTNLIYIFAVIFALMLARRGWSVVKTSRLYLFGAGAFVVMAYEIIFALVDYRNMLLQTRKDSVHFRVLSPMGWLRNLREEPVRYIEWFNAKGAKFSEESALLHLFLIMAVIGIVYLAARSVINFKRRQWADDPRTRLVIATLIVMAFFAAVTQRKIIQYVIHFAPWFALCAAVLIKDLFSMTLNLRGREWAKGLPVYRAAIVTVVLLIAGYGYALARQTRGYIYRVTDPQLATFDEIKEALRDIVPEGVCPASIGSAFVWLAFPDQDQCYFAYMEATLDEPLNLEGKEYALIVRPKHMARLRKLTGGVEKYRLIGEIDRTAYGTFYVYYTGSDPRYLSLEPKRYEFSGRRRGFTQEANDDVDD